MESYVMGFNRGFIRTDGINVYENIPTTTTKTVTSTTKPTSEGFVITNSTEKIASIQTTISENEVVETTAVNWILENTSEPKDETFFSVESSTQSFDDDIGGN